MPPIKTILPAALIGAALSSAIAKPVPLTVSAAVSLKDALEAAKPLFAQAHPGVEITFIFGSSGSLQQQIEHGAPVDVFISAAGRQMDALEAKGLVLAGTRAALFRNQLVLVIPSGASAPASFADLAAPATTRIAIGEPRSVPAGQYANQVLAHFGLLPALGRKLVFGKDVRQVLTYVSFGEVDAGIVYLTDAKTTDKVKIAAEAPLDSHAPIEYPGAVMKSSPSPEAARAFLDFLRTAPEALAAFRTLGFAPAP
jgi:molybdate transport system substrate-binding protein